MSRPTCGFLKTSFFSGRSWKRILFSLSLVHARRGSTTFSWSSNVRSDKRKANLNLEQTISGQIICSLWECSWYMFWSPCVFFDFDISAKVWNFQIYVKENVSQCRKYSISITGSNKHRPWGHRGNGAPQHRGLNLIYLCSFLPYIALLVSRRRAIFCVLTMQRSIVHLWYEWKSSFQSLFGVKQLLAGNCS